MKDVGLRIRVQRELRDSFLAICRSNDKPASQVLREYMRMYVAEHSPEPWDDKHSWAPAAAKRAAKP
jgi:hypothetical protein